MDEDFTERCVPSEQRWMLTACRRYLGLDPHRGLKEWRDTNGAAFLSDHSATVGRRWWRRARVEGWKAIGR